jgi:predicted transcriptional regulator
MLTIVSDLLLTDAFLIKGQIENKYTRLSQVLDEYRKYFIRVRDATLIDLNTKDRIQTPLLHVNVDEILLAHELIDTAGDPHAARMARSGEETHRVRVFYTGNLNVELAGEIRQQSYEATDKATRRFFVMHHPEVRGMNLDGDKDLELLKRLGYAILNKTRLSYIYDFSG